MGQKKLKRFNEIKTFSNVLEKPDNIKGEWKTFFQNNHDIVLELACGKGEYTVGLAKLYPKKNFIGVDIKGNRIWAGAKFALENELKNAAFLRTHIDKIENYFNASEVKEIWITFPDPQLRNSRSKKRLTHPRYLKLFQHIISAGGIIHLKTDSPELYNFTKKVVDFYHCPIICDIDNLQADASLTAELNIKTHYEKLNLAKSDKTFYISFQLSDEIGETAKENSFNQFIKDSEAPENNPVYVN